MTGNETTAVALAKLGLYVFKVRVDADGTKTPMHPKGHLDGTLDLGLISDWFIESPNARIGVDMGRSGLVALDVDVKNGKDGWDSLEKEWLDVPSTFGYDTPSGGRHLIYTAPADKHLAPSTNYRGMAGVDVRGGSSWVLWNGGVPASRDEFSPAPEWLCDERTTKQAGEFEGDVKQWFDSLTPGEPNAIVRKAIERINPDMSHGDMVAATYEAIRLGAELNPGVPKLIEALEEAWLSRDPGGHTTPEDRWEWKFQEALNSGIEKYGEAITLAKDLPEYSLATLPSGIPDRLVVGEPGDKEVFRDLLRELQKATDDDLYVTSVLWNCPRTRDISREWGLTFVHERVIAARTKPEPVKENPSLEVVVAPDQGDQLLTADEVATGRDKHTFIDSYCDSAAAKGFWNPAYDIPNAWTALSMAMGLRAVIVRSEPLGMNLWFMPLGNSGTGKSSSLRLLRETLDNTLNWGDGNYNLGAGSSPEGLLLELLTRDGQPSMILKDEAASFFGNLKSKDWMASLEHDFSDYYMGWVSPSNKLSLKEYRGKSARTSFNVHMVTTPARFFKLIDIGMFGTGFLARFNWSWSEPPIKEKRRSSKSSLNKEKGVSTESLDLAADLLSLQNTYQDRAEVWGTDGAVVRLDDAEEWLKETARALCASEEEYAEGYEPSVTRLVETMWKTSALTALYEGRSTFTLDDVLSALGYVQTWFDTLIRVLEATSESEYAQSLNDIEAFILSNPDTTYARILHRFKSTVKFGAREIDDRLTYLLASGRIVEDRNASQTKIYRING